VEAVSLVVTLVAVDAAEDVVVPVQPAKRSMRGKSISFR
jgi:hypothetical protein